MRFQLSALKTAAHDQNANRNQKACGDATRRGWPERRLGQSGAFLRRTSVLLAGCFLWSFGLAPVAVAATAARQADAPHGRKASARPMTAAETGRRAAQAEAAVRRQLAKTLKGRRKPGLPSLAEFVKQQADRQRLAGPPALVLQGPPSPGTLLDDSGMLGRRVTPAEVISWRAEIKTHPAMRRAATLRLWLGEYALARDEQPDAARRQFRAAQSLTDRRDPIFGLAAFDSAISLFDQGAYAEAADAFGRLVQTKSALPGYGRPDCALWLKHARACAGYHAQCAKAGIPEPPRLDPLCGAAALAACLRGLGLPSGEKTVRAACRVTGLGSSLADVEAAGPKLGVTVRTLTATDEGLQNLPKPLVAFVENDHFIAVVRADAKGVSYLCSDCGMWPGGRVDLTWAQWHRLKPGLYAAATRPGSVWDRRLAAQGALSAAQQQAGLAPPVRLAMLRTAGPLLGLMPSLSALKGVQVRKFATKFISCGGGRGRFSKHCCQEPCPKDQAGSPGDPGSKPNPGSLHTAIAGGPSSGDPVNLATGEEEYTPPTDLTVYNPHGPSVGWGRIYNSLRSSLEDIGSYEMDDFGYGWSHPYNAFIVNNYQFSSLVEPNGARVPFTAPNAPSAGQPQVPCQVAPGFPVLIEWDYDATNANGRYVVTWADRTRWVLAVQPGANSSSAPQLSQIVDRNGHAITFHYAAPLASGGWPLLSSITNEDGKRLLTILRSAGGAVAAVIDCYGREVYYHVGFYSAYGSTPASPGAAVLDWVSQVVPTGTANPAARYVYAYQAMPSQEGWPLPVLHTITVPSPTGNGVSTATINYDTNSAYVSSLVDANGNSRSYSSVDYLHERVTVANPQGNSAYTYVAGFDNNMSQTDATDGAGRLVSSALYSDPSDPYRPSLVMDGNACQSFPHQHVLPGGSANMTITGSEQATGSWSVRNPAGATIATDIAPNGWTVSAGSNNTVNVSAPAGAAVGGGYRAYQAYYYVVFDVVSASAGYGTTRYTWDQFGHLVSMVSPRGTSTRFAWDYSAFALGELMSITEGNKSPTVYSYFEPSGLIHTLTNPKPGTVGSSLTVTTTWTYDGFGNVLTETRPGNNATASDTTTFNYTNDGSYTQPTGVGQPLNGIDNLGKVTHFRYDERGNRIAVIDSLGNEIDFSYDVANQPLTTALPATGQTGAGHTLATNCYLFPGGPLMSVKATDEAGTVVRQVFYSKGLEGEILSVSGSGEPAGYNYDALYRLIALTDGRNQTTSYAYNALGYLESIHYPGGNQTSFPQYDEKGNALRRISGRGIETDYVYNDPESRLTDILYPAFSSLNVHFTYDSYGRRLIMGDGTGSSLRSYDDISKLTSIVTTYNGLNPQTVAFSYYPDGKRRSMTTPAGTFLYNFDAVERMSSLTNPFGETYAWQYLDNGWLHKQTLANGATMLHTYNAIGQMTELLNQASDGSVLSDFSNISYDGVGNRVAMTTNIPATPTLSGLTSFQYDVKNQLTNEQSSRGGGYTNTFAYDGAGNPATSRSAGPNTFNQENQITNTGYGYDGDGNPSLYQAHTLSFDPENRMTAYDNLLTAAYTGEGLRAWKQNSSGVRTYFLYDGMAGTTPVCELDQSGSVVAASTFGPTGLLSRHTSIGSVFYTFDPQGCVVQPLAANCSALASYIFDAFGRRIGRNNTDDPYSNFVGQSGYYNDSETGLSLLTHRYYDPGTGRFLNRDPLNYNGGMNLYAYTDNNTVNEADPTGLRSSVRDPAPAPRSFGCPIAVVVPILIGVGIIGTVEVILHRPQPEPSPQPQLPPSAAQNCPNGSDPDCTELGRGTSEDGDVECYYICEDGSKWTVTVPDSSHGDNTFFGDCPPDKLSNLTSYHTDAVLTPGVPWQYDK